MTVNELRKKLEKIDGQLEVRIIVGKYDLFEASGIQDAFVVDGSEVEFDGFYIKTDTALEE